MAGASNGVGDFSRTPGRISYEDNPLVGVSFMSYPDEFEQAYLATFEEFGRASVDGFKPHAKNYYNRGGRLQPISLKLMMYAEVDRVKYPNPPKSQFPAIVTEATEELHRSISRLMGFALPRGVDPLISTSGGNPMAQSQGYARAVVIALGTWVQWRGFIESVSITYTAPFDASTARPMRADVDLTFIPAPLIWLDSYSVGRHLFNVDTVEPVF